LYRALFDVFNFSYPLQKEEGPMDVVPTAGPSKGSPEEEEMDEIPMDINNPIPSGSSNHPSKNKKKKKTSSDKVCC